MALPGFEPRATQTRPRIAFAERAGAGPAVVLVHGNSGTREVWRPVAERLPRRRLVAVDLRGHGESDWAEPPAYATADYASDLAAVLAALGEPPAALVAHSNGALAAIHLAAGGPAWLRGLVVVDIEPQPPQWQVDYFRERAGSVRRTYPSVADLAERMRAIDPTVPAAVFEGYLERIVRRDPDGVRLPLDPETYASWQPGDLWPALPSVACPLLVVRAGESVVMSAASAERIAAARPGTSLATIPGAGHYPMLGRPDVLAAELERFLAGLGGG